MSISMWAKRRNMIVHEHDPYNAESPRAALTAPITAIDSFYVRNHGPVPDIDAQHWRLTVDGLVDRVLHMSLAELQSELAAAHGDRDHAVRREPASRVPRGPGHPRRSPLGTGSDLDRDVDGRSPGRRVGLGRHPLRGLVTPPSPHPTSPQLADPPQPYGGSIDLAKATAGEVILAWAMNDQPLPPVHGGPVRVVVPGYIGARSVKWIDRITLQATPSDNYFQATAYRLLPAETDPHAAGPGDGLPLAAVALNADILTPDDQTTVSAGTVDVSGYAYAGDDRTVARVDVSADNGRTWVQADVDTATSAWSWQHWHASLDLAVGRHTVTARAWDSTGASQPESAQHLWNPKGYINNSWARVTIHAG